MNSSTSRKNAVITRYHIAPCGMDCALCMAHFRGTGEKNYCSGCNTNPALQSCYTCIIRSCSKRVENAWKYCFECDAFPCKRLKALDKRYRTKYEMSMIANLKYIREHGIRKFVQRENKRWIKNGKTYCVHRHAYY